ncbi:MAG: protease modulator HflC [Gammaproteobacteria bacterium]
MANKSSLIVVLLLSAALAFFSLFTVAEWEKAIVFQLGKIKNAELEPGLHFKLPVFNNVRKFDGRILTLDVEPERFLTAEKKNVIVDSFVMWRIADVGRYYTAVQGNEAQARRRLEQIIKDGMRAQFSRRTINEAISGEREEIMIALTKDVNEQAGQIGMSIVDVRVKRIDLPDEVSGSVYRRMQAERARVAKEFRSEGFEAAERIRADADRQQQIIQAEAYREAEKVRGVGDAIASDTYAKAYSKNGEFYAFTRSLNAYQKTFSKGKDLLVLEPDSEFFDYFNHAKQQ